MHEIDIMDIGGFKIGQAEDTKGLTGCTVFLFDKQSPAGVDIRGGGPASRETFKIQIECTLGNACIFRNLCNRGLADTFGRKKVKCGIEQRGPFLQFI